MRLRLAIVALVVAAEPAMAADATGLAVQVNSSNRNNARHDPTVLYSLTNDGTNSFDAVYVECTALDEKDNPLEV